MFLIIFFLLYNDIEEGITQKSIVHFKARFDKLLNSFLQKFIGIENDELFDYSYKISLKLLLALYGAFIFYVFFIGIPNYIPYLIIFSFLLVIAFTTPKRLKRNFLLSARHAKTLSVFVIAGVIIIWINDAIEGTNFLTLILEEIKKPVITQSKLSGISETTIWTWMGMLLLGTLLFIAATWLLLRIFMLFNLSLFKGFTKMCFWLNKDNPLKPAYVTIQIGVVLFSYFFT